MKLQPFMLSDTLYLVLHVPLVNKSLQFNLYRIHNIPLVHPILKKSLKYSIQEEYLAIRLLTVHFLSLSANIMACQVSNGQFCHINSPLYVTDTSKSCSYTLFLKDKEKINSACMISVINQTQGETLNINDNFWAISPLQDNKKLYITCLPFSFTIKLHFPYDIIYLPNGYEANAIAFMLPSNNKLNIESSTEATEYKLGFNRSYSKCNSLSLMQSLNISSLTDDK